MSSDNALELGRNHCPFVQPERGVSATSGRIPAHAQMAKLVRGNTQTINAVSIKERAKANPKARRATNPKVAANNNKRKKHDNGNRAIMTHRHLANVAFQRTQSMSASFTLTANVPNPTRNAPWYTIRHAGSSKTNVSFLIETKRVPW